jgi:archaemetzincin
MGCFVWPTVLAFVAACNGGERRPDPVTTAAVATARSAGTAPARMARSPSREPGVIAAMPAGPRATVKLVALGDVPDELFEAVASGVELELDVTVERIPGRALPESAYYAPRRRYRAERLLAFLDDELAGEPATTRVLGLTTVDISTTKPPHEDWGVFGLGALGGRSCVVSTHRLGRRSRGAEHRRFRIVTTAVHEVGHTLGLEHCDEPRCVMRDAEGSIDTVDASTGTLGPACRAALDQRAPRAVQP